MNEPDVMVYLMTGFLDSGKTGFLKFTLKQDYFQIDGKTLLILCEDGEDEYDAMEMLRYGVVIERLEDREELTEEYLAELDRKHEPDRVVIEYNGMWKVSDFENMKLPKGWGIEQKITTVDASTFQTYLTNLKPLFVEMVRGAEMVLFNRCEDIKPLAGYRRSVKVVSPQAEVIFEDEQGEVENIFEDDVPYDLDAPVIEIPREDYGIWYVDMMDNPDRYQGVEVSFKAIMCHSKKFKGVHCPGRFAMVCCDKEMQFLALVCRGEGLENFRDKEWVKIHATVKKEKCDAYQGDGPVLYVSSIAATTKPANEMVSF